MTFIGGSISGERSSPVMGSYGSDFAAITIVALALNIPFYAVTVLVLHTFTKSILARPILWCVGIPALTLACALLAFPPTRYDGIIWIALIPLCALFAGLGFAGWQIKSPMLCVT